MKTNIALICQFPQYSKNIAKLLSDKLDMYFVDVEEMIDFELGDLEHIITFLGDKDGKKYIKASEVKVVKKITSFENTVISISPQLMFSNKNFERIEKTSYIIYLQIAPRFFKIRAGDCDDEYTQDILLSAFTERDKLYVQSSDIVVNCSNFKPQKAIKKVLSKTNEFFKKIIKEKKKTEKAK